VASYTIGDGEYGTYTYRFRAKRAPSDENPATVVSLGELSTSYFDRNYPLAVGTLLGGLVLLGWLIWGGVLYQYPRTWRLKVTSESPLRSDVSLSDLDARTFRFDRPGSGGVKSLHWRRFMMHKELRIPTCDLIRAWPEEDREGGLRWLVEDRNVLRIDPRRSRLMDSPGEEWDGPQTCESRRDVHVFARPVSRSRPNDTPLYAWLESKPAPFTGWIVAAFMVLLGLAAWTWFAMTQCHVFV
jgi:hypothetical protein